LPSSHGRSRKAIDSRLSRLFSIAARRVALEWSVYAHQVAT
jgi:hypothetical protein